MSSLPVPLFLRPSTSRRLFTAAASSSPHAGPSTLTSTARVKRTSTSTQGARRGISQSVAQQKALPFALSTTRAETAPAQDVPGSGRMLRMIMFGKPGAGKGTLTARLVKKYEIVSMSTGDLLRQHIAEKTEVGQLAESIVASGGLLPDDIMLKVVTTKLDSLQNRHWILDGFPRTLGQGKLLDAHLTTKGTPLSLVVNLDVPDSVILSRISDRWVHLPSGRVYNLSYNPPKVAGHDDDTGEPLTKRPDDNPEIFARRLEQFYASTSPLLAHYSAQAQATTRLVTLAGSTSDEIWPQLEGVVRAHFAAVRERGEAKRRHSLSDAVLAQREQERRETGKGAVLQRA
ncbi:ADK-domain-containing protein [Lenzites betulinus]|nr:ADK-domain-containing protein [Lenzites betulinus]